MDNERLIRAEVHVFRSHEDARRHEIRQQAAKSPYQRMLDFAELQRRLWPAAPDVRQSGVAEVRRLRAG